MKHIFLGLALITSSLLAAPEPAPLKHALKMRAPEWRAEIVQVFAHGGPKEMIFYGPNNDGVELAQKKVLLQENGRPLEEIDVTIVDDKIVKQGLSVKFTDKGELAQFAEYEDGKLNGLLQTFYPGQKLHHQNCLRKRFDARWFYLLL